MHTSPKFRPSARLRAATAVSSLGLALALTGCSGFTTTATPNATASVPFGGTLHGGQQPVTGSKIFLFGAGTGGYGSTVSSLLRPGANVSTDQYGNQYVTTDASGNFSFTNYACPTAGTPTYILAVGGNPGLGGTVNNTGISAAAAVGVCSSITTSTFVNINEVTTAAFVTAVQQYAASETQIGAPSSNLAGIQIAFSLAQDLATSATGAARTTNVNGTGTIPTAKLNTLGNILAPCINSTDPDSAACYALFNAVTPSGGQRPRDVFDAMLLIAKNPGNNVATIYSQSNAAAPFQPSMTSAPNDFTLGITYTGGGLTAPGAIAIDAGGNAYVTNTPSTSGVSGTDSIVGFGPNGSILTGAAGYTTGIHAPKGIAIDLVGNIWSTNSASGSNGDAVTKFSSGGAYQFSYTDPNFSGLQGIALDSSNNAWVTSFNNNSIVKVNFGGTRTLAPVTSAGFSSPVGIAIDGTGILFAAGAQSNSVLKFNSGGNILSPAAGYTANFAGPSGLAIDGANNVWAINTNSTISKITNNGSLIAPATPSPSIANAFTLSIDGAGGAWFANCRAACGANTTSPDNLTHVLASQAQATGQADGYQSTSLSRVGTAAVDNVGNVWVTNNGSGSVTEFIGVASPVITPIAAGSSNNTLGSRP